MLRIPESDRYLDEFSAEEPAPFSAQPREEPTSFSRLESEGSVVALALAAVALGYGGLLLTSWRAPAALVSPSVVAARPATAAPTSAAAPRVIPVVAVTPDRTVEVRPHVADVSTSRLNAIWRRSDTRSLQQSFARLRRETLAFHHCSLQMTGADRAVARCDGMASRVSAEHDVGARRMRWTLDFQRTGNRWAIERVVERSVPRVS